VRQHKRTSSCFGSFLIPHGNGNWAFGARVPFITV